MSLPYKIATLLYCFNTAGEILLLERAQEPNRGFWSPCGGKLKMDIGESPYTCAGREAHEEIGLRLAPSDLHLAGLISEHGYQGQTHWLMFLFEVKVKLQSLPPVHAEGRFEFFPREKIPALNIPRTDREQIWPWFLAVSRRLLRRPLPLPSGRTERVDAGGDQVKKRRTFNIQRPTFKWRNGRSPFSSVLNVEC